MSDLMRYACELAEDIGPRPVSTEEEHQAAQKIAGWFEEKDMPVNVEEFACAAWTTWPFMVFCLLTVVATSITYFHGGVGVFAFVLALIALGCLVYDRYVGGFFGDLIKKGISQNVVAKYAPVRLGDDSRKRKIIIVAHYDSERSHIEAMPSIIEKYPLLQKILLVSMITIPVLMIVQMIPFLASVQLVAWIISCVFALAPLAAAISVLLGRFVLSYSDGANDNASGVAAMIGVCERIVSQRSPEREKMKKLQAAPVVHSAKEALEAGLVSDQTKLLYEAQRTVAPKAGSEGATQLTGVRPVKRGGGSFATGAAASSVATAGAAGLAALTAEGANLIGDTDAISVVTPSVPLPRLEEDKSPRERTRGRSAEPGVPEWWTKVESKRKSALDEEDAEEVIKLRSRYADIPTTPSTRTEPRAAFKAEPEAGSRADREAGRQEEAVPAVAPVTTAAPSLGETQAFEMPQTIGAFGADAAEGSFAARRYVQENYIQEESSAAYQREDILKGLPSIELDRSYVDSDVPSSDSDMPWSETVVDTSVSKREALGESLLTQQQAAPAEFTYVDTIQSSPEAGARSKLAGLPSTMGDEERVETSPLLAGTFAAGLTGAFVPVGATETFAAIDLPDSDMFIDDADDTFLGTMPVGGGFDTPTRIGIPESRTRKMMDNVSDFFSRSKKKSKKQDSDMGQWLGVARDYDATKAGRDIGSWERFDDEDSDWKGGGASSYRKNTQKQVAEIRDAIVSMHDRDLMDKEVWFVALGAGGADNAGMRAFISQHSSELAGALFINIECVGTGDLYYVTKEGRGLFGGTSDHRLQTLARKASQSIGFDMYGRELSWRSTDATPAIKAGYRSLTLMGFDTIAPVAWRQKTDNCDLLEPDCIERVTDIVTEIVRNS
ncbi:MAG: hypothetical protein HGA54_02090 [Actinobacteria bacterium]|nr:hypothetical protein [Actinomycetota bacterium]